jgi:hypothetical protein
LHKYQRLSLQALVRKTGSNPTPDQQRDITLKRARLQDRVDTFQKQAANFIHAVSDSGDDSWEDTSAREVDIGMEFDGSMKMTMMSVLHPPQDMDECSCQKVALLTEA